MPYIHEIVNIINTSLATGKLKDDSRFNKALYGVAETLPRNYNDEQDGIPAVVDLNGGIQFSGFDDRYSIVIYHKVLSTSIVDAPIAFGDGNNAAREEAQMRMIVFADRMVTKLQPTQLSFLLLSAINQQLQPSQITTFNGLFGVNIEPGDTNYNGVTIYGDEYRLPASTYPVQPHQIYIALDYTITTDFDTTCISDCLTC